MTLADELRVMLDKAQRYIHSADSLRVNGDFDSAVSRLYYAMFYCTEAVLVADGRTYSSHKAIIAAFGQHYIKTKVQPQELHEWLREAFEKRQISDYDFMATADEEEVLDLASKAAHFVTSVEDYLTRTGHL